jgi:acyl-CoA reductase-like NAD-dependent aldehyde dehydrogenase
MHSEVEQAVRRAWSAAKRAVRAYSRDPCETNAEFVRLAFLYLRRTREREFVSNMSLRAEGASISEQQWNKVCEQCRVTFVSYLRRSDTPCGACPVKELDCSDFGHVTLPEPLPRHATKAP